MLDAGALKAMPEESAAGRPLRVLFVDDEPSLVQLARYALERAGWEVVVACTGEQAAAVFAAEHASIDVIVLDLVLPDCRGRTLLDRLAAIDDTVPVVIASGMEAEQVAAMLGERPDHFIHKPYSLTSLPASLRAIVSHTAAV
ncbi:MAG: response regulator transcription factor [Armatimonadota bacterium]